jgi:group I intron endonuclease
MKNSILLFNQENFSGCGEKSTDNIVLITVYPNIETCKDRILSENKGKAGIYQWIHKESGKSYIGSAVDLSNRFRKYFSKSYLNNNKSMYINNALLHHGYSAFSLSILEYLDISGLSKDESKKLILSREQHYIDSLSPEYNILKVAGSSLGYIHTKETLIKMSEVKIGKTLSEETKALLSKALSGENHPMFGGTHSAEAKAKISEARTGTYHSDETKVKMRKPKSEETKTKMSEAKIGRTHTAEIKAKMSEAHKGKTLSAETKALMSKAKTGKFLSEKTKAKLSLVNKGKTRSVESKAKMSQKVFVYTNSTPTILSHEFVSYTEAAKHFSCSIMTISNYIKSGKLFKEKWILYSSTIKE